MNNINITKTDGKFTLEHGPLKKVWIAKQKLVNYVHKNYFPELARKQVLGMVNDSISNTDKPIVLEGELKSMRDEVVVKKDLDRLQKHLWNNRVRHFKSEHDIIERFLKKNQHLKNRMSIGNPQSEHEWLYEKLNNKFTNNGADDAKHLLDVARTNNESKWTLGIVKFYKQLIDQWESKSLVKPERLLANTQKQAKSQALIPTKPTDVLEASELHDIKYKLLKDSPELEFHDYQIDNVIYAIVDDEIELKNVIEDQREMCDKRELEVVNLYLKAIDDYIKSGRTALCTECE